MNTPKPHVLVLCDYFPPAIRAGGAAASVGAIVEQESKRSLIEVVTSDSDLGLDRPFTPGESAAVDRALPGVRIVRHSARAGYLGIWRRLRGKAPEIDVVYLNSLFSPRYTLWPLLLMSVQPRQRHRILLAPRGELSPGALSIKPRRKKLVSWALRLVLGYLDVTWHVSSIDEATDVRTYLQGRPPAVFVRSDPAVTPAEPSAPDDPELTITFAARMVPNKNLELLIRAAAGLTSPTTIMVAGVLEDQAYWRRCVGLIDRLPSHVDVRVLGHVDRAEIGTLLRRSDAMVLPTWGENFGHVIAEALSVGCPVMVPDTTPWTALVTDGCGWIIDVADPTPTRECLERLAARPLDERRSARRRVAAKYAGWWATTQVHEHSLFVAAFDTAGDPSDDGN